MNRLNTVTTRMGTDLRDAIEIMPGLGGIALWVKFIDTDDPLTVAATDGIYVEAGPLYSEYNVYERRFILLHELLHVALAHPARTMEMMKRCQDFDPHLYNIACDAIINASLDDVRGILAPDKSVSLERVLTLIGQCVT
jgi:predicted metal-dependent peptidase